MRMGIVVFLAACSSSVTHAPPPPTHTEPPLPLPAPVAATPTEDLLPDSAGQLVELDTDEYKVSVYQNGMVGWQGIVGVQSIGERRGRIPDTQVKALARVLDDAKFTAMKDPPNNGDCEDATTTSITYWASGDSYGSITDDHCPSTPELDALEAKVLAYTGADLWIHGNPGGVMPDGDHLLFSYDETACFGQCPEYTFLVFDDGTLIWHGEANVSVTGDKRATLTPDRVQALIDAFSSAGWLPPPPPDVDAGPGEYAPVATMSSSCTDTPHTVITYQRGNRHETQDNAHCDGDWDFDDHVLALAGVDTRVHTPVEVLRYEQTMCLGTCPSYAVTVNDVGDVAWKGEKYVDAVGDRTAKLGYDQLQALEDAFAQAKFFDLAEKTDKSCTDHPETRITFTKDNQTHSVIDFHCKEDGTTLGDLEKTVHGLLSLDAWIGAPKPAKTPKKKIHGH